MQIENKQNQDDSTLDSHKIHAKALKGNDNTDTPHPPTPTADNPLLDVGDETALLNAAMAEVLEKYSVESAKQAHYHAVGLASTPTIPRPRKKRYVGGLQTPRDVASELAAIYKEAYHGVIPWHQLTRATYTLDCLARAMQADANTNTRYSQPKNKAETKP